MPPLLYGQAEARRHRWSRRAVRASLRRPQGNQEVANSRPALLNAKCKALVRAGWGDVVDRATPGSLPGGAALADGDVAWVLAEDDAGRSLGAALAWAARHGATRQLNLMASSAAGSLARRAARFERPVTVYAIVGSTLVEAAPEPLAPAQPNDPVADVFRPLFAEVGAEAVVEDGLLRAEVLGLEVARVEVDQIGAHLAIGVGKHDRDAHLEVHGEEQSLDALFEVVRIVAEHRVAGGGGHAAFHLASERWLRAVVVRRPELVRAASLHPVPSPVARPDLRQAAPAPAAGVDRDGAPVLVVCSTGLDVDLVPAAVDAWLADGRQPRLVLCVPAGDDHRVTRDLAGALTIPAEVVTVERGWREL